MSRYVSVAKPPSSNDWWYSGPMLPLLNVDDRRMAKTGLVDQYGNEIVRLPSPVGFGRDNEA